MLRSFTLLILFLFVVIPRGIGQIRIAYYDLDRLYDTSASLFYDDTDYTPQGRNRWNNERYSHKIRQVAAVIDTMQVEVMALYGVENEQVVRDLAMTLEGDYTYLHQTLNALDGMDFALLYKADKLEVLRSTAKRSLLTIEALIAGDTVAMVLGVDPRFVRLEMQEQRDEHPTRPMVVAGRIASIDPTPYGLIDRLAAPARRGHGNRIRNGGWQMRDRIFTPPVSTTSEGAVYVQSTMIDPHSGEPLPTYRSGRYVGGIGRYLPVWCRFR